MTCFSRPSRSQRTSPRAGAVLPTVRMAPPALSCHQRKQMMAPTHTYTMQSRILIAPRGGGRCQSPPGGAALHDLQNNMCDTTPVWEWSLFFTDWVTAE